PRRWGRGGRRPRRRRRGGRRRRARPAAGRSSSGRWRGSAATPGTAGRRSPASRGRRRDGSHALGEGERLADREEPADAAEAAVAVLPQHRRAEARVVAERHALAAADRDLTPGGTV